MEHTKLASVVFIAVALLHILRVLLFPDLPSLLPLWLSAVAVVVSGMLLIYYLTHLKRKFKMPFHAFTYYISAFIFAVALLVHLSRLTVNPFLFDVLPLWPSYFGAPFAALLAYGNWEL